MALVVVAMIGAVTLVGGMLMGVLSTVGAIAGIIFLGISIVIFIFLPTI